MLALIDFPFTRVTPLQIPLSVLIELTFELVSIVTFAGRHIELEVVDQKFRFSLIRAAFPESPLR